MNDTVSGFKHNLFGGFRQSDVMNCLKRIAAQRNEYKSQCQTTAEQILKLENENTILYRQLKQLQNELKKLENENTELKSRINESSGSLDIYKTGIDSRLASAIDEMDSTCSMAEQTSTEFSEKAGSVCSCLHKCMDTLKAMREELNVENKSETE